MNPKIRSLMDKFAITEDEARDLLDETIDSISNDESPENHETEFVEENNFPDHSLNDEYEDQDTFNAMNADIDLQTFSEGTPEFNAATETFNNALANLKKAGTDKTALDMQPTQQTQTPQQELDQAPEEDLYTKAVSKYSTDPQIDETAIQQAVAKVNDLDTQTQGSMTPEEKETHLDFYLNKTDEQTTLAMLRNSDKNLGVKEAGQLVRSRFNPNYFKNVKTGNWYELNWHKVSAPREGDTGWSEPEDMPGGYDNPLNSDGTANPPTVYNNNDNNSLSDNEKNRLSKLLQDVQENGLSVNYMLGTLAGFLRDDTMQPVGNSDLEKNDFEKGRREGGVARGGNQEAS